ncbi:MAG: hypothetical protein IIZ04_00605 [Aeriscardovia sp.]|nr:hypothetical protein [Aeriscardovia sp.]
MSAKKKNKDKGLFPDWEEPEKAKAGQCPICAFLAENPKESKAVLELLTFCTNPAAAFFLTPYIEGTTITADDIVKHKEHSKSWAAPFKSLPKLYKSLDFEKAADSAKDLALESTKTFILDSLQGRLLYPGKTSPYAAMQGIKIIMDAEAGEDDDSDEFMAGIVKIVLENVKDPTERRRIAEALQKWQSDYEEGK